MTTKTNIKCCKRCGGSGSIEIYKTIRKGVCFGCLGTGFNGIKPKENLNVGDVWAKAGKLFDVVGVVSGEKFADTNIMERELIANQYLLLESRATKEQFKLWRMK